MVLSGFAESAVVVALGRVEADGRQRGHVHGSPGRGASASHMATAQVLAVVVGPGRRSEQVPALEVSIEDFPFIVKGVHTDNGSQ